MAGSGTSGSSKDDGSEAAGASARGRRSEGFTEEIEYRLPRARGMLRVVSDAGHGGHSVIGSLGERAIRVPWSRPEGVLGSAVDIQSPVHPSRLERAAERQKLLRGAKGVFGAGAQKERAASVDPVFGSCLGESGMDDRRALNGTTALASSSTIWPPAP